MVDKKCILFRKIVEILHLKIPTNIVYLLLYNMCFIRLYRKDKLKNIMFFDFITRFNHNKPFML